MAEGREATPDDGPRVGTTGGPECQPWREVAPLAFAEVTLPAEFLGDLEAWLLRRRWSLRQRPNDDLAWYAVPVIGEPDV